MSNILDIIIESKKEEIKERKNHVSIFVLEKRDTFNRNCFSLKNALLNSSTGIIAEFKRKSPSKGWIHSDADAEKITQAYSKNGASGISILTDYPFFGGKPADLIRSRTNVDCPILRKDFIIDEYQLYEAKSFGADIVLLIAAALTTDECKKLACTAKSLGMETILEIHHEDELKYLNKYIDIVGINNRDLKTFNVSVETSIRLADMISNEFIKISESGISDVETVCKLRNIGYKGFLMGENFMKENNPPEALKNFIASLT